MGTASFSVSRYARSRGSGNAILISSNVRTSGAFTTSTTAANLEDGSGDITLTAGEVIRIHADEAMRVNFAPAAATTTATAATASTGHYIPADGTFECECEFSGYVSIIDVA